MQRYADAVLDKYGKAIKGAAILVKTIAGEIATLYKTNGGGALDNPIATDALGRFAFYAADGRYSLEISVAGVVYTTVPDIILEDPADESIARFNGGTIKNAALSNVTIDGAVPITAFDLATVQARADESVDIASQAMQVAVDNQTATQAAQDTADAAQATADAAVPSVDLAAPSGASLVRYNSTTVEASLDDLNTRMSNNETNISSAQSAIGAAQDGISAVLAKLYPAQLTARVKPSGFGYVPGSIWECITSGQAKHDIDLEQEFRTTYGAEMGRETGAQADGDTWVDPVNGNDTTGTGALQAPYKTLKKAVTLTLGTIWLKPGRYTEKLDIRNTDRQLGGGQSRAIMIKAWGPAGSAVFVGPGQQPSAMTWTANGSLWESTPSGGEIAEVILYIGDGKEIPIQYVTSAAAINTRAYGWYQDPTTKKISIRYEGRDISLDKAKFEILYQTPGNSILYGSKTYIEGVKFRGGNQIDVVYQNAIRPILYAKNCTFEYLSGSNVHTEGAICFTQNCTSRRALVNDGFNYYDSIANGSTPGGVATQALEVDNICSDNGVPEAMSFVTYVSNQDRNKQGSSGHESSIICRINGTYSGNYGQNIADTGIPSKTWMVGSVLGNPYGKIGGGATFNGFYNLWIEGSAYLDTVTAGGRLSTHGLFVQSGTANLYRCGFTGTTAAVGGAGTVVTYDPLAS